MSNARNVSVVFIFALHLLLFTRFFWLSDDGIIVFRVVRNFLEGNGIVYNVGERCQAYTSPLWMFYLTPFFAVFPTAGSAAFFAHLLLLCLFLRSFFGNLPEPKSILFGGISLALSTAYLEYTSSGLENVLVYYLIILTITMSLREDFSRRFFLVVGLLFLARMDAVLFTIYPVFLALRKLGVAQFLRRFSLTVFLASGWLIFATFYYGFPLPNTYYAKLHTGISSSEYFQQGLVYLIDFFIFDPTGAFLVLFAICFLLYSRSWYVVGLLLHIAYVVKIGGDFQSGRFFGGEVVQAAFLLSLAVSSVRSTHLAPMIFVLVLLSLANKFSLFQFNQKWQDGVIRSSGIAPERVWYVERDRSFFSVRRNQPLFFTDPWLNTPKNRTVTVTETAGFIGYVQPGAHLVDVFALTDPLLSKLPSIRDPNWRIGHFSRRLPLGYLKTLESGVNQIAEDSLRDYYEKLRVVTRGSLFSLDRLKAIAWLNSAEGRQRLLPSRGIRAQSTSCELARFEPNRAARFQFADLIEVFSPGLEIKCGTIGATGMRIFHRGAFKLTFVGYDTEQDSACVHRGSISFGPHHAEITECSFRVSSAGFTKVKLAPVYDSFLFFGVEMFSKF